MQSTDSFHASDGAEGAGDGIRPCNQNVSKGGRGGGREGEIFVFNCVSVCLCLFYMSSMSSQSLAVT